MTSAMQHLPLLVHRVRLALPRLGVRRVHARGPPPHVCLAGHVAGGAHEVVGGPGAAGAGGVRVQRHPPGVNVLQRTN